MMIWWLASECTFKLPQLRKKFDKSTMEERAQLSALLVALRDLTISSYPISRQEFDDGVLPAFVQGSDANLVTALQGILHTKPPKIDLLKVPTICDLINARTVANEQAQFGVAKTEKLNIDIQNTEFDLVHKKLEHDIGAFRLFRRRSR